jgi:hypothetical protein
LEPNQHTSAEQKLRCMGYPNTLPNLPKVRIEVKGKT